MTDSLSQLLDKEANGVPIIYSGSKTLTEPSSVPGLTVGQLVLSPTRTYAPIMRRILADEEGLRPAISGAVHCSGGAQTKVLHFLAEGLHVVKDKLFPLPPLFELIQKESGTSWHEMYRVFNMGHRLELYVRDQATAERIIAISSSFGVDAQIVGRVETAGDVPGRARGVTVRTDLGEFVYG